MKEYVVKFVAIHEQKVWGSDARDAQSSMELALKRQGVAYKICAVEPILPPEPKKVHGIKFLRELRPGEAWAVMEGIGFIIVDSVNGRTFVLKETPNGLIEEEVKL